MGGGDGRGAGGAARPDGVVAWAVAVYRGAARLLPDDFRRAYGEELVACFGDIAAAARRSRGRWAVGSVLTRSIVDLVLHAPQQHLVAARAGVLAPGSGWSGGWLDVRQAARRLARRPTFAGASVLTLGLGIAAATSVFSLVDGVVLSPLPYPESERIVRVDHAGEKIDIDRGLGVTYGFYRFYAEHLEGVESIAMYQGLELTLTGRGDPVRLEGVRATPSLASVLRVRPAMGRWFAASEGEAGGPRVVVLSHRVWQDRLGADPGVPGSVVELGGEPWEVIGIMGDDFAFPDADTDFWVPRVVPATGVGGWNEHAVARLAPASTPAALEREMEGLYRRLREITDDPGTVSDYLDDAGIVPRIVPLKDDVVGDVRVTLWILLGTVGFVFLIAVANVANLFLVRAEERQRETAVRAALGAGRTRIFRGALAETLMVAAGAAAVGIGGAAVIIRVLRARAPVSVPRLHEVGLDATVLAVALGTTAVAALVLGAVPALGGARDPGEALRESGRRSTGTRARSRGRSVLVAGQVALALILLVGSGLLFRTFQELRTVDPGFTTRRALTFEVGLPNSRYPDRASAMAFHDRLLEQLRALPGVVSASAVGSCLPLAGTMCWGETLEAEGYPTPAGQVPPVTAVRVTSTDYFETMGIPVRGRTFTAGDQRGAATVAVLSEAAAAAYFPGKEALGHRMRFDADDPWHTIAGVAGNVKGTLEDDRFQRVIYLPVLPETTDGPWPGTMSYVLRTAGPPTSLAGQVRSVVGALDPGLPVARMRPLQAVIDDASAPTAFALTLIGLAAAMALLLGAVGVYGVVAYSVSRRTAEIGIRIAMGARRAEVQRMVIRQGGAVVLVGILVGLIGAFGLTRLMSGMLYAIEPTDPASYVAVTGIMLVVVGLALWLPARRASGVEPVEALRAE